MFDAPWHWVVVAIIVIALFGYKRMPDAARSLGRSLRIFKTEIKGMTEDDEKREQAKDQAREQAKNPPAIEPAAEDASSTPPVATKPAASSEANAAKREG